MNRKILFWGADGLSDHSDINNKNKTPLEIAEKPTIDTLSRSGGIGLLDPFQPGFSCGSDTSHLSLFGYDPSKYYRGRGILEALGSEAPIEKGDLVFKCSFGLLNIENQRVIKRGLKNKLQNFEWNKLFYKLNEKLKEYFELKFKKEKRFNLKVRIWHSGGFRSILYLRGLDKNHESYCEGKGAIDPLKENEKLHYSLNESLLKDNKFHFIYKNNKYNHFNDSNNNIKDKKNCYCETIVLKALETINDELNKSVEIKELTKLEKEIEMLLKSKANSNIKISKKERIKLIYLNRSPSFLYNVDQSFEMKHGLKGAVICNTPVVKGVAKLVGLSVFNDFETFLSFVNSAQRLEVGIFDFVFVHFKKTDDFSHLGKIKNKVKEIEKIDKVMEIIIGEISKKVFVGDDFKIAFTGDHTTSCFLKKHSCEPVPFLVTNYKDYINLYDREKNSTEKIECKEELIFSERSQMRKKFGRIPIKFLLEIMKF